VSLSREETVIILAPTGNDAANVAHLLAEYGFKTELATSEEQLCLLAKQGSGALLVAEEALSTEIDSPLAQFLRQEPSWSDLPILVVTSGGDMTQASLRAVNVFGESGNLTLLERPFRAVTLVSALQVAIRARRRQYQVRDMMGNLEELVGERTKQLEESVAELEAFSYTVSHDLRAPLRAMQGYSHFLLEEYSKLLDAQGVDFLVRIKGAASRLDRLIQDILTCSRVAKTPIEMEPLDPEALIREILNVYTDFQPPRAEITLVEPFVPIIGHEAFLTQCISNLLTNAIKFVEPAKTPAVKIWCQPSDRSVRLCFKDNGVGIDPAYQGRIFRMFERGPDTMRFDGTGIGLAIVQKAVERMGGSVGVESQSGQGSTFWIELKAA
jgi:signal transduction histidine kinase